MKFSVPTNWQNELLGTLNKDYVDELYGKLNNDFVGGGRPSFMLPNVSQSRFKQHLEKVQESKMKFNYLLNATCVSNRELTIWGQKKLRRLLDWIVDNKIDSVTVSLPYLLQFVKHNYPNLKVYVSTMAGVDSLQRAKYWESLGADRITLAAVSGLQRNFTLLRKIKANVSCELQLIVNLTCLYECPFWTYHSLIHSHASQSHHQSRGFLIDYCFLKCNYLKIKNPVEFIRSGWIRPEDIHHYEEIGFNRIKFANRNMSTESIIRLTTSYVHRHYEGNLLDLFSDKSKCCYAKEYRQGFMNKLKYLFRPFSVNIFKLLELSKLLDDPGIYIDNRLLDGFLEHFKTRECSLTSCQDCNYCQQLSDKVIRIDAAKQAKLLERYRSCLDNLTSGSMFTYFNKR